MCGGSKSTKTRKKKHGKDSDDSERSSEDDPESSESEHRKKRDHKKRRGHHRKHEPYDSEQEMHRRPDKRRGSDIVPSAEDSADPHQDSSSLLRDNEALRKDLEDKRGQLHGLEVEKDNMATMHRVEKYRLEQRAKQLEEEVAKSKKLVDDIVQNAFETNPSSPDSSSSATVSELRRDLDAARQQVKDKEREIDELKKAKASQKSDAPKERSAPQRDSKALDAANQQLKEKELEIQKLRADVADREKQQAASVEELRQLKQPREDGGEFGDRLCRFVLPSQNLQPSMRRQVLDYALKAVSNSDDPVLNLSGMMYGDEMALLAAAVLRQNPAVKEVNLGNCAITDIGASILALSIGQAKDLRLKTLVLASNDLTCVGAVHLMESVMRTKRSFVLDLHANRRIWSHQTGDQLAKMEELITLTAQQNPQLVVELPRQPARSKPRVSNEEEEG